MSHQPELWDAATATAMFDFPAVSRETAAELGLHRDLPAPGAERLLRALVLRGLADRASLVYAAALALALEDAAVASARHVSR